MLASEMQTPNSFNLPAGFESIEDLEAFLSLPSVDLVDDLKSVDGDIMILGVGGKMGPTLARLARRAAPHKRVIGVARFSDPAVRERLNGWGVETIYADLLDRTAIAALPEISNIIFAAGHKFGATGNLPLTWAMNAHVPALVAERFQRSRIVAFSTGNVYPLTLLGQPPPTETSAPAPIGEYAQSCLARERMFEYFSKKHRTAGRIVRLNYAIDMRYGVLHDIASRILRGDPVDLTMGYVNLIWQGDANEQVLRCLGHCTEPTSPINSTGLETLAVRDLAGALAKRLGLPALTSGQEAGTALLSDASLAGSLFGAPRRALDTMLDWVADWVSRGGESYNKPTKFEVRDGRF